MANYNTLKTDIQSVIRQNDNNEITGQILQQSLLSMVNSLGAGYQYMGVATPTTNPGTPDARVFYLASTAGTYTGFNNLVVNEGEVAILKYDTAWNKELTGLTLRDEVIIKRLVSPASSARELISTDGTKVTSSLYTYYYDVSEGQKFLAKIGNFTSSGFSVVSLWNGSTFVSSVINSPTTTEDIYITIPSNVNKVAVSYFANCLYEVQLVADKIKEWQPIITDYGYKGSLANTNLDDTSLGKGVYFIVNNQYTPFLTDGLLYIYGYATFIQQRCVNLRDCSEYARTYSIGGWTAWNKVTKQNFYKGSISSSQNINDVQVEGTYYADVSLIQGTLPEGLQGNICLLQVITAGGNYTQQTLIDLVYNAEYHRTYKDGWSSWDNSNNNEDIRNDTSVIDKPNLLLITGTSQTINGVTFTINEDKTVTAEGTATSAVSKFLGSVMLPKGQYWISGTPTDNARTDITLRIIYTGGYKDLYQGRTAKYQINLSTNDTISIYAVVSYNRTCPDNCIFAPCITKVGTLSNEYVEHGKDFHIGQIGKLVAYNTAWAGRKICGKGDSIMAGAAGNWLNVVAQRLGLSVVNNYGIGGSRMAYYGDGGSVTAEQSVVATWDEMDNDADIVIIHAGTNDWASQVPLGDVDSTNRLEFNGALNIIMSGLREKYPTALIVFNTILPRVDYDSPTHNGQQMAILTSQYSEAIKDRCKAHHIVCNDIYESCGLDLELDYNNQIYATTNDGLHPNEEGAKILGRKIAGFINSH